MALIYEVDDEVMRTATTDSVFHTRERKRGTISENLDEREGGRKVAESWQNPSSLIPSSTRSKDAHLTLLFSSVMPRTSYVLGCLGPQTAITARRYSRFDRMIEQSPAHV